MATQGGGGRGTGAKEAQARRLAEALRENLKRRKAQARGRAQDGRSAADETPDETAPAPPTPGPDDPPRQP